MDRPKHRRLILLGFTLLAGAVVLLLGRQWTSAPDQLPGSADSPARQLLQPQHENVESASVAAAAPSAAAPSSAPPSATATGFRGRIIDAVTREPVKEFAVELARFQRQVYTEDAPIVRNFKSATGRFLWADVAEGTWRAAVTAPGYQQFNVDDLQIAPGKATREIVMPLRRGYAVRGRVFELSTGAGVVDATISFRPAGLEENFFRRGPYAKSKDDGSFTLDGVPGGDVALTVSPPEHAPRSVAIVVDEKTPAQEIAVSTGGTIAGIVTTPAGAPVKGSIHLLGPEMNFLIDTNDAGQFSFPHMRPGHYRLSAGTGAGGATQDIALGQDEIKDGLVLVLEAGRSVRGMVRGLRADQLAGVGIVLRSDSKPGSISADTDQQGAYVLNGVAPGHAVMTVFSEGLRFDKSVDIPVDRDVTIDIFFPAGARLSGRVTQAGKPVVGKSLWMRPVENVRYALSLEHIGRRSVRDRRAAAGRLLPEGRRGHQSTHHHRW